MKTNIFYNKNVHQNAGYYYQQAKETREKLKGIEIAIEETKQELKKAQEKEKIKQVRVKREKEWFEKFHYYITQENKMMIGGRNAQQNDILVSKKMEDQDLFFHADIQGGAVVILKNGISATKQEKEECAQFAASFSNAWKNGNASVDVYCAKKEQLTKNISGGFVPTGAFAIIGEREWFRSTKLGLKIGILDQQENQMDEDQINKEENKKMIIAPEISKVRLKNASSLIPAQVGFDKGQVVKMISKRLEIHPDELLEILPNGKSKVISSK